MAQRWRSHFSPSGPGFESRFRQDFFNSNFSILLKILLYCLVRGQFRDRTHLVLMQGISQMQLVVKA